MKKVTVYKADGTPIQVFDFEVKMLKNHGIIEKKPIAKEKKPTGYTKERKQSKTTK